jgi:hypothetical protein
MGVFSWGGGSEGLNPAPFCSPLLCGLGSLCLSCTTPMTGPLPHSAARFASKLTGMGYSLVSGGTDNHLVLVDLQKSKGIAGARVSPGALAPTLLPQAN